MTEFLTPVDIANRALQHCGATRIDPSYGFAENSKNASETAFCYGKLRRAELRQNVWKFAAKNVVLRAVDATTMLLSASMWSSSPTYFVGSIVSDQSNNLWISNTPNNVGNDPQNSLTWEPYFGPLSVSAYAAANAYSAGEMVYTAPGDGTNRVYLSLQNGNSDNPATPTNYDATATYIKNQVVTYLGTAYMSLIDLNMNQTPAAPPAFWDSATTYALNDVVTGSNNITYKSLLDGNNGNDPTFDAGVHWQPLVYVAWTPSFVGGAGSSKWLQIGGIEFPYGVTLTTLNLLYPLGMGSSLRSGGRNVYRMPAGFLRIAPQNPNSGTTTWLGGPTGIVYSDWTIEGDYLVTQDSGPLPLRFVADLTDVRRMDDMFCEGFAARIAMEVCEPITQSGSKLGNIAKIYDEWISRAKTANGIETGSDDPPDDDYLTVRL